ncbi:transposase [Streptomyces canus]
MLADPALRALYVDGLPRLYQLLADLVRTAQEAGDIAPDRDPDREAELLFGLADSQGPPVVLGLRTPEQATAAIDYYLDHLFRQPPTAGHPGNVGVSAGDTHDSEGLKPMIEGHQTRHDPHRGRYFKPQRLHADKAYDRADLRKWLRGKRIGVRVARKGIESSERLGRRRRGIEPTMSWLSGYRRLSPRSPLRSWSLKSVPTKRPCAEARLALDAFAGMRS